MIDPEEINVEEPPEGVRPTPEQWVKRFLTVSREDRLQMATVVLAREEQANSCFMQDHVSRITNLQAQVNRLVQENNRLADRAGIAYFR